MALGSNNPFPSVLVVEQGSAPTTPAAGRQRLFVRSSDGHLCRVDDAGSVTDLEDVGAGDVVGPGSTIDERIAVFDGTTGKLLKDGGQTIAEVIAAGGGGGSGATIHSSAYGSAPGAPASGDLWLPSNSFYALRYSGSAWVPWGPTFPFTDPALAGLSTWVNQGGASVDTTYGGIHLLAPAGAGDNLRMRVKTAPATPYTITAAILANRPTINFAAVGLAFRQSGDGKIATFAFVHDTLTFTSNSYGAQKFTNATTFSANYGSNYDALPMGVIWMQISDDGANRICRYSANGQHWVQVHSVSRTDFLTSGADQVGIFVNAAQATWPVSMTLLSWKES